jgi:MOSC domain-containing protein YiiM
MTNGFLHLPLEDLEAGLCTICQSPKDAGILHLIVRRPRVDEREVVNEATLDPRCGLVGDNWHTRGSTRTPDRAAHPEMQITLMNSRVIELLAREKGRWPLAGDQLYVDLDLARENLPPGTRLAIGSAVIQVSAEPHTGCQKFRARFGADAVSFVNSPEGKRLRLRGINAKVVRPGTVHVSDVVTKI